ncbi:hypothetical protein KP509_21G022900 [Ceratopteris richardii]|uniref:Alpha-1,6-mannosyl-glycoprotein 2-beta-N-acetylglucosaminyltransferase n=1 Tax=Ceratopteris richardii TaxID=49495 RepID=A0A8T2SB61_CERRI|nr:hypothetical protein KP509_21G022900 [Ceratopteris richardii]
MSPLHRSKWLLLWKLGISRRCLLIVSLQAGFIVAFFIVHLLFIRKSSLRSGALHVPREGAYLRFSSLCPQVKVSKDNSADKLPWKIRQNMFLPRNELSWALQRRNALPPRNLDLFPVLPADHIVIVLYVHNRPAYLKVALEGLSKVVGISEALLVVSHDGFFPEMNSLVESINFCQVKQLFAPFSPHIFPDSFPGTSLGDCNKADEHNCTGDVDQYGNYRAPRIVSLKHHWWWMMNTVWDGLLETHNYSSHILFIEEDHFLFPNALMNIRALTAMKACKCPSCYMANLAPADVNFKGERRPILVADKIGNVGYAFNRSIWRKIHQYADEFCSFDDYNWDITMWVAVYPEWEGAAYSLRGPRRSAQHFGKCGLHQGQKAGEPPCFDEGGQMPPVEEEDNYYNSNPDWLVRHSIIRGYDRGFKGWGGWGDKRDRNLCLDFASMYHMGVNTEQMHNRGSLR